MPRGRHVMPPSARVDEHSFAFSKFLFAPSKRIQGAAMLIKILFVVAAVVVVLAVTIATRPSAFRIQRSVIISAPARVVFAHLEDFHRWSEWSPYEKLDPAAQKSYS